MGLSSRLPGPSSSESVSYSLSSSSSYSCKGRRAGRKGQAAAHIAASWGRVQHAGSRFHMQRAGQQQLHPRRPAAVRLAAPPAAAAAAGACGEPGREVGGKGWCFISAGPAGTVPGPTCMPAAPGQATAASSSGRVPAQAAPAAQPPQVLKQQPGSLQHQPGVLTSP
jgi:hypothetical protein